MMSDNSTLLNTCLQTRFASRKSQQNLYVGKYFTKFTSYTSLLNDYINITSTVVVLVSN